MEDTLKVCYNRFNEKAGKLHIKLEDKLIQELHNISIKDRKEILKYVTDNKILKKVFVSAYQLQHFEICQSVKEELSSRGVVCE